MGRRGLPTVARGNPLQPTATLSETWTRVTLIPHFRGLYLLGKVPLGDTWGNTYQA